MKIRESLLEKISVIYLVIPFVLFLIFWLKPLLSIVFIPLVFFLVYKLLKRNDERFFEISKYHLFLVVFICLIWCIISGIGGLYYQSVPDWNIKNAIMHDLIEISWPVTYDNGARLVYYFGTFLPSAFVGKFIKLAGFSSYNTSLFTGITSLLWALTGIVLVILNIFSFIGVNKKNLFLMLFVFVFFSGMDILLPIYTEFIHIEWHPVMLQYSSIMTMMVWAYNQAIAPWLITILFLKRYREVDNYGFYGVLSFFYAPLTFIGLSVYLVFGAIVEFFRSLKGIKNYLVKLFDIKNIICLLMFIPILYLFYKSNYTAEYRKIIFVGYNIDTIWFLLLEALLYLFVVWKKFCKSPIFYITLCSLIIIPAFRLSDCLDFSMRVSVPAIFIMVMMVLKFLCDEAQRRWDKFLKFVLSIFLLIGLFTPACEIARGVYYTFIKPEQLLVKNYARTLNNKIDISKDWIRDIGDYKNYGCLEPEKSLFFKYLSR